MQLFNNESCNGASMGGWRIIYWHWGIIYEEWGNGEWRMVHGVDWNFKQFKRCKETNKSQQKNRN